MPLKSSRQVAPYEEHVKLAMRLTRKDAEADGIKKDMVKIMMQVTSCMEDQDGGNVVKRLSVPVGLEELMTGLTKEVLQQKPKDIYNFASDHFAQLLALRDNGNYQQAPTKSITYASKENVESLLFNGDSPSTKSSSGTPTKLSRQVSIHAASPTRKKEPRIKRSGTPKYENNNNEEKVKQDKKKPVPSRRQTPGSKGKFDNLEPVKEDALKMLTKRQSLSRRSTDRKSKTDSETSRDSRRSSSEESDKRKRPSRDASLKKKSVEKKVQSGDSKELKDRQNGQEKLKKKKEETKRKSTEETPDAKNTIEGEKAKAIPALGLQHSGEIHDTVISTDISEDSSKDKSKDKNEGIKDDGAKSSSIEESLTGIKETPNTKNAIEAEETKAISALGLQHSGEIHDIVVSTETSEDSSKDKSKDENEYIKNDLQHSGEIHDTIIPTETSEDISKDKSKDKHDAIKDDHLEKIIVKSSSIEESPTDIKETPNTKHSSEGEKAKAVLALGLQHSGEIHDTVISTETSGDNLKDKSKDKNENIKNDLQHSGEIHDTIVPTETSEDSSKDTLKDKHEAIKDDHPEKFIVKSSSIEESTTGIKDGRLTVTPPKILKGVQTTSDNFNVPATLVVPVLAATTTGLNDQKSQSALTAQPSDQSKPEDLHEDLETGETVSSSKDDGENKEVISTKYDPSTLREELQKVEEESKLNNFTSSYNPYKLKQEIRNASKEINGEEKDLSADSARLDLIPKESKKDENVTRDNINGTQPDISKEKTIGEAQAKEISHEEAKYETADITLLHRKVSGQLENNKLQLLHAQTAVSEGSTTGSVEGTSLETKEMPEEYVVEEDELGKSLTAPDIPETPVALDSTSGLQNSGQLHDQVIANDKSASAGSDDVRTPEKAPTILESTLGLQHSGELHDQLIPKLSSDDKDNSAKSPIDLKSTPGLQHSGEVHDQLIPKETNEDKNASDLKNLAETKEPHEASLLGLHHSGEMHDELIPKEISEGEITKSPVLSLQHSGELHDSLIPKQINGEDETAKLVLTDLKHVGKIPSDEIPKESHQTLEQKILKTSLEESSGGAVPDGVNVKKELQVGGAEAETKLSGTDTELTIDETIEKAASKIQAGVRGFLTRMFYKNNKPTGKSPTTDQDESVVDNTVPSKLSDKEVHQALTQLDSLPVPSESPHTSRHKREVADIDLSEIRMEDSPGQKEKLSRSKTVHGIESEKSLVPNVFKSLSVTDSALSKTLDDDEEKMHDSTDESASLEQTEDLGIESEKSALLHSDTSIKNVEEPQASKESSAPDIKHSGELHDTVTSTKADIISKKMEGKNDVVAKIEEEQFNALRNVKPAEEVKITSKETASNNTEEPGPSTKLYQLSLTTDLQHSGQLQESLIPEEGQGALQEGEMLETTMLHSTTELPPKEIQAVDQQQESTAASHIKDSLQKEAAERELTLQHSGELHDILIPKEASNEIEEQTKLIKDNLEHSGELHDILISKEASKEVQGENKLEEDNLQHSGELHDLLIPKQTEENQQKDKIEQDVEVGKEKPVPEVKDGKNLEAGSLQHSSELHDILLPKENEIKEEFEKSLEIEHAGVHVLEMSKATSSLVDNDENLVKDNAQHTVDKLATEIQGISKEVQDHKKMVKDNLQHSGELHDLLIPKEIKGALQETNNVQDLVVTGIKGGDAISDKVSQELYDDKTAIKNILQHSGELHDVLNPKHTEKISQTLQEDKKNEDKLQHTATQDAVGIHTGSGDVAEKIQGDKKLEKDSLQHSGELHDLLVPKEIEGTLRETNNVEHSVATGIPNSDAFSDKVSQELYDDKTINKNIHDHSGKLHDVLNLKDTEKTSQVLQDDKKNADKLQHTATQDDVGMHTQNVGMHTQIEDFSEEIQEDKKLAKDSLQHSGELHDLLVPKEIDENLQKAKQVGNVTVESIQDSEKELLSDKTLIKDALQHSGELHDVLIPKNVETTSQDLQHHGDNKQNLQHSGEIHDILVPNVIGGISQGLEDGIKSKEKNIQEKVEDHIKRDLQPSDVEAGVGGPSNDAKSTEPSSDDRQKDINKKLNDEKSKETDDVTKQFTSYEDQTDQNGSRNSTEHELGLATSGLQHSGELHDVLLPQSEIPSKSEIENEKVHAEEEMQSSSITATNSAPINDLKKLTSVGIIQHSGEMHDVLLPQENLNKTDINNKNLTDSPETAVERNRTSKESDEKEETTSGQFDLTKTSSDDHFASSVLDKHASANAAATSSEKDAHLQETAGLQHTGELHDTLIAEQIKKDIQDEETKDDSKPLAPNQVQTVEVAKVECSGNENSLNQPCTPSVLAESPELREKVPVPSATPSFDIQHKVPTKTSQTDTAPPAEKEKVDSVDTSLAAVIEPLDDRRNTEHVEKMLTPTQKLVALENTNTDKLSSGISAEDDKLLVSKNDVQVKETNEIKEAKALNAAPKNRKEIQELSLQDNQKVSDTSKIDTKMEAGGKIIDESTNAILGDKIVEDIAKNKAYNEGSLPTVVDITENGQDSVTNKPAKDIKDQIQENDEIDVSEGRVHEEVSDHPKLGDDLNVEKQQANNEKDMIRDDKYRLAKESEKLEQELKRTNAAEAKGETKDNTDEEKLENQTNEEEIIKGDTPKSGNDEAIKDSHKTPENSIKEPEKVSAKDSSNKSFEISKHHAEINETAKKENTTAHNFYENGSQGAHLVHNEERVKSLDAETSLQENLKNNLHEEAHPQDVNDLNKSFHISKLQAELQVAANQEYEDEADNVTEITSNKGKDSGKLVETPEEVRNNGHKKSEDVNEPNKSFDISKLRAELKGAGEETETNDKDVLKIQRNESTPALQQNIDKQIADSSNSTSDIAKIRTERKEAQRGIVENKAEVEGEGYDSTENIPREDGKRDERKADQGNQKLNVSKEKPPEGVNGSNGSFTTSRIRTKVEQAAKEPERDETELDAVTKDKDANKSQEMVDEKCTQRRKHIEGVYDQDERGRNQLKVSPEDNIQDENLAEHVSNSNNFSDSPQEGEHKENEVKLTTNESEDHKNMDVKSEIDEKAGVEGKFEDIKSQNDSFEETALQENSLSQAAVNSNNTFDISKLHSELETAKKGAEEDKSYTASDNSNILRKEERIGSGQLNSISSGKLKETEKDSLQSCDNKNINSEEISSKNVPAKLNDVSTEKEDNIDYLKIKNYHGEVPVDETVGAKHEHDLLSEPKKDVKNHNVVDEKKENKISEIKPLAGINQNTELDKVTKQEQNSETVPSSSNLSTEEGPTNNVEVGNKGQVQGEQDEKKALTIVSNKDIRNENENVKDAEKDVSVNKSLKTSKSFDISQLRSELEAVEKLKVVDNKIVKTASEKSHDSINKSKTFNISNLHAELDEPGKQIEEKSKTSVGGVLVSEKIETKQTSATDNVEDLTKLEAADLSKSKPVAIDDRTRKPEKDHEENDSDKSLNKGVKESPKVSELEALVLDDKNKPNFKERNEARVNKEQKLLKESMEASESESLNDHGENKQQSKEDIEIKENDEQQSLNGDIKESGKVKSANRTKSKAKGHDNEDQRLLNKGAIESTTLKLADVSESSIGDDKNEADAKEEDKELHTSSSGGVEDSLDLPESATRIIHEKKKHDSKAVNEKRNGGVQKTINEDVKALARLKSADHSESKAGIMTNKREQEPKDDKDKEKEKPVSTDAKKSAGHSDTRIIFTNDKNTDSKQDNKKQDGEEQNEDVEELEKRKLLGHSESKTKNERNVQASKEGDKNDAQIMPSGDISNSEKNQVTSIPITDLNSATLALSNISTPVESADSNSPNNLPDESPANIYESAPTRPVTSDITPNIISSENIQIPSENLHKQVRDIKQIIKPGIESDENLTLAAKNVNEAANTEEIVKMKEVGRVESSFKGNNESKEQEKIQHIHNDKIIPQISLSSDEIKSASSEQIISDDNKIKTEEDLERPVSITSTTSADSVATVIALSPRERSGDRRDSLARSLSNSSEQSEDSKIETQIETEALIEHEEHKEADEREKEAVAKDAIFDVSKLKGEIEEAAKEEKGNGSTEKVSTKPDHENNNALKDLKDITTDTANEKTPSKVNITESKKAQVFLNGDKQLERQGSPKSKKGTQQTLKPQEISETFTHDISTWKADETLPSNTSKHDDKDKHAAATTIQSTYRGYRVRTDLNKHNLIRAQEGSGKQSRLNSADVNEHIKNTLLQHITNEDTNEIHPEIISIDNDSLSENSDKRGNVQPLIITAVKKGDKVDLKVKDNSSSNEASISHISPVIADASSNFQKLEELEEKRNENAPEMEDHELKSNGTVSIPGESSEDNSFPLSTGPATSKTSEDAKIQTVFSDTNKSDLVTSKFVNASLKDKRISSTKQLAKDRNSTISNDRSKNLQKSEVVEDVKTGEATPKKLSASSRGSISLNEALVSSSSSAKDRDSTISNESSEKLQKAEVVEYAKTGEVNQEKLPASNHGSTFLDEAVQKSQLSKKKVSSAKQSAKQGDSTISNESSKNLQKTEVVKVAKTGEVTPEKLSASSRDSTFSNEELVDLQKLVPSEGAKTEKTSSAKQSAISTILNESSKNLQISKAVEDAKTGEITPEKLSASSRDSRFSNEGLVDLKKSELGEGVKAEKSSSGKRPAEVRSSTISYESSEAVADVKTGEATPKKLSASGRDSISSNEAIVHLQKSEVGEGVKAEKTSPAKRSAKDRSSTISHESSEAVEDVKTGEVTPKKVSASSRGSTSSNEALVDVQKSELGEGVKAEKTSSAKRSAKDRSSTISNESSATVEDVKTGEATPKKLSANSRGSISSNEALVDLQKSELGDGVKAEKTSSSKRSAKDRSSTISNESSEAVHDLRTGKATPKKLSATSRASISSNEALVDLQKSELGEGVKTEKTSSAKRSAKDRSSTISNESSEAVENVKTGEATPKKLSASSRFTTSSNEALVDLHKLELGEGVKAEKTSSAKRSAKDRSSTISNESSEAVEDVKTGEATPKKLSATNRGSISSNEALVDLQESELGEGVKAEKSSSAKRPAKDRSSTISNESSEAVEDIKTGDATPKKLSASGRDSISSNEATVHLQKSEASEGEKAEKISSEKRPSRDRSSTTSNESSEAVDNVKTGEAAPKKLSASSRGSTSSNEAIVDLQTSELGESVKAEKTSSAKQSAKDRSSKSSNESSENLQKSELSEGVKTEKTSAKRSAKARDSTILNKSTAILQTSEAVEDLKTVEVVPEKSSASSRGSTFSNAPLVENKKSKLSEDVKTSLGTQSREAKDSTDSNKDSVDLQTSQTNNITGQFIEKQPVQASDSNTYIKKGGKEEGAKFSQTPTTMASPKVKDKVPDEIQEPSFKIEDDNHVEITPHVLATAPPLHLLENEDDYDVWADLRALDNDTKTIPPYNNATAPPTTLLEGTENHLSTVTKASEHLLRSSENDIPSSVVKSSPPTDAIKSVTSSEHVLPTKKAAEKSQLASASEFGTRKDLSKLSHASKKGKDVSNLRDKESSERMDNKNIETKYVDMLVSPRLHTNPAAAVPKALDVVLDQQLAIATPYANERQESIDSDGPEYIHIPLKEPSGLLPSEETSSPGLQHSGEFHDTIGIPPLNLKQAEAVHKKSKLESKAAHEEVSQAEDHMPAEDFSSSKYDLVEGGVSPRAQRNDGGAVPKALGVVLDQQLAIAAPKAQQKQKTNKSEGPQYIHIPLKSSTEDSSSTETENKVDVSASGLQHSGELHDVISIPSPGANPKKETHDMPTIPSIDLNSEEEDTHTGLTVAVKLEPETKSSVQNAAISGAVEDDFTSSKYDLVESNISPRVRKDEKGAVPIALGKIVDQQLAITTPRAKEKEEDSKSKEPDYIYIPLKGPQEPHVGLQHSGELHDILPIPLSENVHPVTKAKSTEKSTALTYKQTIEVATVDTSRDQLEEWGSSKYDLTDGGDSKRMRKEHEGAVPKALGVVLDQQLAITAPLGKPKETKNESVDPKYIHIPLKDSIESSTSEDAHLKNDNQMNDITTPSQEKRLITGREERDSSEPTQGEELKTDVYHKDILKSPSFQPAKNASASFQEKEPVESHQGQRTDELLIPQEKEQAPLGPDIDSCKSSTPQKKQSYIISSPSNAEQLINVHHPTAGFLIKEEKGLNSGRQGSAEMDKIIVQDQTQKPEKRESEASILNLKPDESATNVEDKTLSLSPASSSHVSIPPTSVLDSTVNNLEKKEVEERPMEMTLVTKLSSAIIKDKEEIDRKSKSSELPIKVENSPVLGQSSSNQLNHVGTESNSPTLPLLTERDQESSSGADQPSQYLQNVTPTFGLQLRFSPSPTQNLEGGRRSNSPNSEIGNVSLSAYGVDNWNSAREDRSIQSETPPIVIQSTQINDNSMPLAVQLNQPPGAAVLTSPTPNDDDVDAGGYGGAHAPEKGASTKVQARKNRAHFRTSMETDKRKNATIKEKNMEEVAATKIQAGFRGYQVRKQLKLKNGGVESVRRSLRRKSSGKLRGSEKASQKTSSKPSDLEEKSATKIQAGIRGFLVRRRQQKKVKNSTTPESS